MHHLKLSQAQNLSLPQIVCAPHSVSFSQYLRIAYPPRRRAPIPDAWARHVAATPDSEKVAWLPQRIVLRSLRRVQPVPCEIDRAVIMNGLANSFGAPPAAQWQEHRTPDGRPYFYNSATKVTQWTKPEDMMTPAEVRFQIHTRLLRAALVLT